MKFIKQLGAACLLGFMAFSATAQTLWEEGVHYQVISDKASDDKQVKEVFSFWCPGCFAYEPIVAQINQQLPGDVGFVKAHVDFMGSAPREVQQAATSAMLAAKVMKESKVFNDALFNAIHEQRKTISGMEDIKAVFAAAGGDAEKMEKLTKSFGIKGQMNKNNQLTQGFSRVPTFVVNEKYQVNFTRDMSPDDFVSLILWLTEQR